MSAVATPSNTERPPPSAPAPIGPLSFDAAVALVLGAAVVAIAFTTKDGTYLGASTWTEILLVLLAAAAAAGLLIFGGRGRASGLTPLLLFAALAALTYASIAWSVQPANSWLEGNRTLSYLATFITAVAVARLAPRRWTSLIGTVALASCALSGWALLTKVFPGALDAADTLGRLSAPFGYWNATALAAALGFPAVLWLGARPQAPRALRIAAGPAICVLFTALFLSYGRGALVAAAIGVAVWLSVVPFRLRAAAVLVVGILGAVVPVVWAVTSHSLMRDNVALGERISEGRWFGVVLLLTVAVLAAIGYAGEGVLDRITVLAPSRRRSRALAIGGAALVPIIVVAALAGSSRGLTGEVSHLWSQLTDPTAHVGDTSSRLLQLGSSRPLYWREGLLVGEHAPFKGVGAGGFDVAGLRYDRVHHEIAAHAHSYVIETFADLGTIGLVLSLALLIAWARAAARTMGPRAGPKQSVERAGLATLLAIVVTFGIHSAIDWTWFVPGVALPALACAGWLAGRGPLTETVGRAVKPRKTPGTVGAIIAIVTVAFAAAWAIWQPLRAADAESAAQSALIAGNTHAAFEDLRSAAGYDPESIDALSTLAALYEAVGDPLRARAEYVRATSLQPDNPITWQQLGEYDYRQHRPRLALAELKRARVLNPSSVSIADDIAKASAGSG